MFGFLKTLIDKGAEKEAQAAIDSRARQMAPAAARKAVAGPAPGAREQAMAQVKAQAAAMMSPERQALIKNAVHVHRAKQQIFESLDDESRAKLVAMAITTLLNQGREPESQK